MCIVYLLALEAVSIAGMVLGYPEALFVWIIPLFTGCSSGEEAQQPESTRNAGAAGDRE